MTKYIPLPKPKALVKLTGRIRNLEVERIKADFLASAEQEALSQKAGGVVAVLATLAGAGGAAMGSAANNKGEAEEADYVSFELDNKKIEGWLKYSPFKDGDMVDVTAEPKDDHWVAYAVARPDDRMIALYPHCKRSKSKHIRAMIKAWLIWGGSIVFIILLMVLNGEGMNAFLQKPFWIMLSIISIIFTVFCTATISKYMHFALLAEKIFQTLEFSDPFNVDLRKSSKKQRTEPDKKWLGIGKEYGKDYFRY